LVKFFSKYGLTSTFNENPKEWSSDLHCIVQLPSKTTQTKEDKEGATQCIDTLFDKDTTENWGHCGRTELGTKSHLQKMSNFALPLVILTWQGLLLEHFHDNSGETFFELGNYSARPTKYAAAPLDNLYLIRRDRITEGQDTQFFSFDCLKIKEELSILQWADYILQQDANLETTNEKKTRLRTFENRPMKTYKMTTNAIKWRITDEKDTDDTHQQVTSLSKGNKVNYDCLRDKSLTLLKNMAETMDVSKRYYEQLKQKTNDQKHDKSKVNIGCASLVQYMKNKLQADAQLGWNAMLEWISDQAKLKRLNTTMTLTMTTPANRTITWVTTTKEATRT
jgi:hypothetical protein